MSSFTIGLFIAAGFCFVMAMVCSRKGYHQFSYFWTIFCVVLILFGGGAISDERAQRKYLELGEYYSTQCQLIETNIDNGLFQSNTNKLKCGDVIENVTVSDYKEAIEAYQSSNVQMNKLN
ncbi:hypothetical protein [Providencia sp. PROV111]|uniref:hypothetical protein n=1 Tax=Providencia sp. PROV111 TaxID=2949822 RepID=UPI00234BF999|nr:hypothetical protein [Providencia sp. PROV111]